ncbi:arylesterase [Burkholderia vietnamiensis]|uniref:arylesterase n=1 Tax=Burkholderia vietnamiensis TaxID=60552 RepID=UPI0007587E73|nr:arylesterase [Burkholderia vietnamiensis]KVE21760.1 arylesterase [Burkholderia vietnamiensis]KVF31978.1 arylesterase [Burkholderia vietnamiensis]MBR8228351.1 arylesterase [Burkholderia vietnamiensis]MBR8281070.1 arylesterase [Burkholderia vietnamiensis]MCA8447924.1 arylesterase [Burkholderia vietnamiensis]
MDTTFRWKRRAALAALLATLCAATVPARAASAAPAAPEGRPTLVVLGDSLSAEYGLPRDTGWVALLRQRLATERIDYSVANASVSGDTTSGGRARLPAVLQRLKPSIVIVELGSNDALRGVPVATTEQNLRDIIAAARRAHAQVMLVGMYVPPNYGPDYTQKFHAVYTRLSKQLGVPLVPFLLAGIENKPEMFQSDQMHPGEQAQRVLLDNVWPTLQPLLGKPRG